MAKSQAELWTEEQVAGVSAAAQLHIEKIRAVRDLTDQETKIHVELEKIRGRNYQTAVDAVAKWEAAKKAGTSKAMIDALVELTKLGAGGAKPNMQSIDAAKETVRANPGLDPKDYAAQVWQEWAKRQSGPEHDNALLPTYRTLEAEFGPYQESYISPADKEVWGNMQRVLAQVKIQAEEAQRAEGVRAEALQFKAKLDSNPNATPGELQTYMHEFPMLGDSNAVRAIERVAERGYESFTMMPETAEQLKEIQKEKAAIGAPGADEMDDWAWRKKIMSKPGFQWWAKSNGFKIGHVEGDRWVSGPDDEEALKFADHQMTRRPDQDLPWQHRRRDGGTPEFGEVRLKGAAYMLYGKPISREDAMTISGGATDPAKLAKLGITEIENGEADGEVLRGKLLAPRYGDAVGSIRIQTGRGSQYILPDQMAGEPVVTSGGGEKQTIGRFLDVLGGRVAENTEEKRREEKRPGAPDPAPADMAAKNLVPAYEGVDDKEKRTEQQRADEMVRRRKEEWAQKRITGESMNPNDRPPDSPGAVRRFLEEQDHPEEIEDNAAWDEEAKRMHAEVTNATPAATVETGPSGQTVTWRNSNDVPKILKHNLPEEGTPEDVAKRKQARESIMAGLAAKRKEAEADDELTGHAELGSLAEGREPPAIPPKPGLTLAAWSKDADTAGAAHTEQLKAKPAAAKDDVITPTGSTPASAPDPSASEEQVLAARRKQFLSGMKGNTLIK